MPIRKQQHNYPKSILVLCYRGTEYLGQRPCLIRAIKPLWKAGVVVWDETNRMFRMEFTGLHRHEDGELSLCQ